MKRKSHDDEATTTGFEQPQAHQLKRRRHTPPNTRSPSLPEKSLPPSSRAVSVERVSEWLDSLPESPLSLQAAASDTMPSDQQSTSTRPPRSNGPSSRASGTSHSSSPSRLGPQNYRAQVLSRVDIRVDADTREETLQRLLPLTPVEGLDEHMIAQVATELYEGARELLERQTANEAEWVALLSQAIPSLMRNSPDRLCCLPNRDWQAALKPVAYTHRLTPSIPHKRGVSTALSAPSDAPNDASRNPDYPTPGHTHSPAQSQSAAAPFANRPDLPPPAAPRLHLEPAPARLQPKTPRPDLSIGLSDSDASWAADGRFWTNSGLRGSDVKDILVDLQQAQFGNDKSAALITDPCTATPSGLRFPFFMVEVKSGGSASIADAENQSAVSAACALHILRTLSTPGDAAPTSPSVSPSADDDAFAVRTFSLTTEGPVHVLWAHHRVGHGSHMVWLGAFRVTNQASALDLVRKIACILRWGAVDLRDWVRRHCMQYIGRISGG